MEAIILAGGRGTRLSRVVPDVPKPMATVAGQPFLTHQMRWLASQGVDRVCLSIGHLGHVIEAHFGAAFEGTAIVYAREESPLGTGGAVRAALACTTDEDVLVFNGDSVAVVDLRAMMRQHCEGAATVTMALSQVQDTARYGAVQVKDGIVAGFREKGESGPGCINAGIYALRRDCFDGLGLPQVFSFEQDFLAAHLEALKPRVFVAHGEFIDIGIPEDYARAQTFLPRILAEREAD